MADFNVRSLLDVNELNVWKTSTPELIVVNRRAYEATTSIGKTTECFPHIMVDTILRLRAQKHYVLKSYTVPY
jgi:hypothetical protein